MGRSAGKYERFQRRLDAFLIAAPKPPDGLRLQHPTLGSVLLSSHAWCRFVQRCPRKQGLLSEQFRFRVEFFTNELQLSFKRTVMEAIEERFRIARMIRNGFQPVQYWFDGHFGLRYVVASQQPEERHPEMQEEEPSGPTIITVEYRFF